ncbi:MAG: flagellar hook-basal body complex protein FliE [Spirochaetes bacterium]|nr:flagellar hook-basal body complex protein FliE [Spirochaetota bacterium]
MNIKPLGANVSLMAPNARHIGFEPAQAAPSDFLEALSQSIRQGMDETNGDQLRSEQLNLQMATAPDSVNVHDVMIASEKAQMSLDLTRNVLQKAVAAYQALTNLR